MNKARIACEISYLRIDNHTRTGTAYNAYLGREMYASTMFLEIEHAWRAILDTESLLNSNKYVFRVGTSNGQEFILDFPDAKAYLTALKEKTERTVQKWPQCSTTKCSNG